MHPAAKAGRAGSTWNLHGLHYGTDKAGQAKESLGSLGLLMVGAMLPLLINMEGSMSCRLWVVKMAMMKKKCREEKRGTTWGGTSIFVFIFFFYVPLLPIPVKNHILYDVAIVFIRTRSTTQLQSVEEEVFENPAWQFSNSYLILTTLWSWATTTIWAESTLEGIFERCAKLLELY